MYKPRRHSRWKVRRTPPMVFCTLIVFAGTPDSTFISMASTVSGTASNKQNPTHTITSTGTPTSVDNGVPAGSSSSSKSNTGAIIGGVVGGLGGAALLAGAVYWFVFRRRSQQSGAGSRASDAEKHDRDGQYPHPDEQFHSPMPYAHSTRLPEVAPLIYVSV